MTTKTKKVIAQLKAKANSSLFNSGVRMPSITSISNALTELEIPHTLRGSTNIVEHRSGGNRYVNSRHGGKEGKILIIEVNGYLELDTSDSYYSYNTHQYARKIVALINDAN